MAKLAPPLIFLLVLSGVVGCDSSSDVDGCVYSDSPDGASGSLRRCPRSTFDAETVRGREVAGIVRRGADAVSGAVVRVEAWEGLPTGKTSTAVSTITDGAGFFGGLRPTALRYDLLASLGKDASGGVDVLVYRGAGWRYFEPAIEIETETEARTVSRAWSGRFDVRFGANVPDEDAVAFFASGEGVFGVSGDATAGLIVHTRDFTNRATLHAVAYKKGADLSTAKAYGRVDVDSDGGVRRLATFHLDPIPTFAEPRFVVTDPATPSPEGVDVIIGFTRSSGARLTTMPLGVAKRLPVIPDAGYTYRARVEDDHALFDTGEIGLDVYAEETSIELPRAPTPLRPGAGEALAPDERLVVSGAGVLEHILVPVLVPGGPEAGMRARLRIITSDRDAAVPDLRSLGLGSVSGRYSWSVRSFPSLRFAEELSGPDARRFRPMAQTKPRDVELR